MKNAMINVTTVFIGLISFIFITGLGFVLTMIFLVVGLIAKPFVLKNLKQNMQQVQAQQSAESMTGSTYEGKFQRVID